MANQLSELVYVTSPGMGHLAAAVEFAKLLVARDDRLSVIVYVVKLPSQIDFSAYIDGLVAAPPSPRVEFVDLSRLEGYDASLEAAPGAFKVPFVDCQKPLVRRLVRSRPGRIAGLVVDMFSTSMVDVADELGVPAYVFYPSPASFLAVSLHLQARGAGPAELGSDPAAEFSLPGFLNPVPASSLPSVVLDVEESWVRLLYRCTERFRHVKGIIVNSFEDLESGPLRWLATGDNGGLPPVYAVGPIFNDRAASESDAATLAWLDAQPPKSVAFLCFGSMGSFYTDQVKEIAIALDRSGTRFLWSLRRPPPNDTAVTYASQGEYSNLGNILPSGFEERTAGRGRVIGWAPQAAVLAHPAVGGFVTHCGWNSLLESLWWGVPTAVWPIHAEQHLNAFQMARELGLAEEIRLDYKSGFYSRGHDRTVVGSGEIEAAITRLLARDSQVRKRVEEMSQKSRKAVVGGGSSHSSLDGLIVDVFHNYVASSH